MLAEADLHRLAAEHADQLKLLDERYPQGFVEKATEREQKHLTKCERALAQAAEAKGRAVAQLDALVRRLGHGLDAAAAALGSDAAVDGSAEDAVESGGNGGAAREGEDHVPAHRAVAGLDGGLDA